MRLKRLLIAVVGCAVIMSAGAQTNDVWSVRRFQHEFCGEDSWEPFNRSMFSVFDVGMKYVVDPFCYLYSSIVPKPLITCIDNFSENVEEPVRIFSNLFMAEWRPAWTATERLVVNSTIGLGGLFDPAEDWFYLFDSEASFSDTLAAWGIPAGPPLALPFVPRSSLRGHFGYLVDYAFDAKTWFDFCVPTKIYIGYSWTLVPNKAPVWRGTWASLFYHADDTYQTCMPIVAAINDFNMRQVLWRYREDLYACACAELEAKGLPEGGAERAALEAKAAACIDDVRPPVHDSAKRPEGLRGEWRDIPGYAPRSPSLDSLRALCFSPLGDNDFWWERRSIWNGDFSKSIEERDIEISEDLPDATYSFVTPETEDDGPSRRLVVILPGIGAGRTASEAVAMAEFLQANGYAVVICDSIFHWEHMRSVNRGILPGNIAEDAKRLADYLGRILDDLVRDERVAVDPEIGVIGWSMGGLTTAHLAALDVRGELPFRVHRFVAINPPASMDHALAPFEASLEASRGWSHDQAYVTFARAAPALVAWAQQDHPRYDPANPPVDAIGDAWDYAPNITDEQANFLLGQTLRVMFPTLVLERHRAKPFPWIKSELTWFSRRAFYDEIGDVPMREYITRYVPCCYDGVSAEELVATGDIRRLGDALVRNDRFSILHTRNDPLETDDDRRYLDALFGRRITWFADGGHCGYFYTKPFQSELLRRLAE